MAKKKASRKDVRIKAERVMVREEEMLTEISKRFSFWPQLHVPK